MADRPAETLDGVLVEAPHPPGRAGHVRVGYVLGVFAVTALTGEVQQFNGHRWVTVLVGEFPVTDRRAASRGSERPDTWGSVPAGARIMMGFDGSSHDHITVMRFE